MLQNTAISLKAARAPRKQPAKCNPRHEQLRAADKQHTFIRNNRGVQLHRRESVCTRMYLQRCHRYFAAEEELSDSTGLSHGSVSIGASETALNIYLLDRLKTFHMAYPGIRLKIYNHSTPQAINAVKRHD